MTMKDTTLHDINIIRKRVKTLLESIEKIYYGIYPKVKLNAVVQKMKTAQTSYERLWSSSDIIKLYAQQNQPRIRPVSITILCVFYQYP